MHDKKKDTKVQTRRKSVKKKKGCFRPTLRCNREVDVNVRTVYRRMSQQSAFWWGCWPGLLCCSGFLYCSEIRQRVPLLYLNQWTFITRNTIYRMTVCRYPVGAKLCTRVTLSRYERGSVQRLSALHPWYISQSVCVGISPPRACHHVSNCLHLEIPINHSCSHQRVVSDSVFSSRVLNKTIRSWKEGCYTCKCLFIFKNIYPIVSSFPLSCWNLLWRFLICSKETENVKKQKCVSIMRCLPQLKVIKYYILCTCGCSFTTAFVAEQAQYSNH